MRARPQRTPNAHRFPKPCSRFRSNDRGARRRPSMLVSGVFGFRGLVAHDLSCWRAVHCPLNRGLKPHGGLLNRATRKSPSLILSK